MSILKGTCVILLVTLCLKLHAQNGDCVNYDERYPRTAVVNGVTRTYLWHEELWNFTNLKQKRVSGLDIGGTGLFRGLLEYTPTSYSLPANSTKKYPVIIYFHGGGSQGNGTSVELCRLFKDRGGDSLTHKSIPGLVERNTSLFSATVAGETIEYIVISPQFYKYTRLVPGQTDYFPSADEVEDVIDYVEENYRIDPRKIFLTGFSNGANMIMEYAASSVARAQRIAALMPISLCSQLGHENNNIRNVFAKNVGLAKLKTWFVYCESDPCSGGPALNVPNSWVDSIMKVPGAATPRYTRLRNLNPATLYNCSDTLPHDAWSRAFDPNFKASFEFTPSGVVGANDGINQNMYEWFSDISSALLPVKLKDYTARLVNEKVEINWTTTDEKDNASFSIERAGADQHFVEIGKLQGAVNHQGDQRYSFTDNNPLNGLNYYRLVQTDIDGKKEYFEIKKILSRSGERATVVVSPNPFQSEISAFISLDKSEKVSVMITDMTGKILKSTSGIYGTGSTEIKFASQDFPKGIYLVRVAGETASFTKKIVKR